MDIETQPITAAVKKRTNVTTDTGAHGVSVSHDGVLVGGINVADIHPDAHPALVLAGARALLAAARDADGVAARIAALKAGKTSTRAPAAAKDHPPLIRAIALAYAHDAAALATPKVTAKLPGGKPNPAFEALLEQATAGALSLNKETRKVVGRRKDVMIHLANLIGE